MPRVTQYPLFGLSEPRLHPFGGSVSRGKGPTTANLLTEFDYPTSPANEVPGASPRLDSASNGERFASRASGSVFLGRVEVDDPDGECVRAEGKRARGLCA